MSPAAVFARSTPMKRIANGKLGDSVSARSIMGLMMLGAGLGAQVTLSGDGPDAADAIAAIEALIISGFNEDD